MAPPLQLSGEEARKKLLELRERYANDARNTTFNALILGNSGSGKTHLIGTARRPILMHNFDPNGPKTIRDLEASGDIVVVNYYDEEKGDSFAKWEQEIGSIMRNGFLDMFATYAIDSLTLWFDALIRSILKRTGKAQLTQPEWGVVFATVKDYISRCTSYPVDFISSAHLLVNKDELTSKVTVRASLAGQSAEKLPIFFDEVYITQTQAVANGMKYRLLTRGDGFYDAKTRIGHKGQLAMYEDPDIKSILRKCGLSAEDKPRLDL